MSLFEMKGKNALVIGCGGIGSAIAQGLAKEGVNLVLSDISEENLDKASNVCRAEGVQAATIAVNIDTKASCEDIFAFAKTKFQTLDMLVNSAGISKGAPAMDMPEGDWNDVMNHFVNAVFWCCQQAARWMAQTGGGKILNIASMSGVVCTGTTGSPYAAAKAAVIHMSKYLAYEWIKNGINVNALSPGNVDTALTVPFLKADPAILEAVEAQTPIGRIAQPEDMVGPALFLLSPASNYVVGHNLLVDGGYTLC